MRIKARLTSVGLLSALLTLCLFGGFGGAASAHTAAAAALVVLERDSGRILAEKDAHRRLPMASTTKIATAITVIDRVPDLDKRIKVPKEAVGVEGSSVYLQAGEELTYRDLLYGLMLQSGNDCAAALAYLTAGDIPKFAELMNATAEKAGAANTNFVNPHGLHHDDHYTTAYDLGRIAAYALRHPVFAEIVAAKRYAMPWAGRDYNRIIVNKNKLLHSFAGADGVKTGFTKKAGRCLVSSATRGGMTVVAVVLNCGPMFEECAGLMETAFGEYARYDLAKAATAACGVTDGKSGAAKLAAKGPLYYPLKETEIGRVEYRPEAVKSLRAPVRPGQINGKMKIMLDNHLLFDADLYTMDSIEGDTVGDKLKDLIEDWAAK